MFRKSIRLIRKFKCNLIYRNETTASEKEVKVFDKSIPVRDLKLFPIAKYGGENLITVITDGSEDGEFYFDSIKRIFLKAKAPTLFELMCTKKGKGKYSCPAASTEEILLSVRRNRYALDFHSVEQRGSFNLELLQNHLNLYVSVMHFFPLTSALPAKQSDYDIVFITENMLGDQLKLEYEPVKGMVETLRMCDKKEMQEFLDFAVNYAVMNNRKKITFAHKKEYFHMSDGMFIDLIRVKSRLYPDIKFEEAEANTLGRYLIKSPGVLDMICASERYASVLVSAMSGLAGGSGLYCASNIGHNYAIFQPLENRLAVPLEEGTRFVPYGVIAAAVQLLIAMGECRSAEIIWQALLKTLIDDNYLACSQGGDKSDEEIVEQIICHIKST